MAEQTDFKSILAPYYDILFKSTLAADAQLSMTIMHPQAVIVEKDKTSTFGTKDLTKLYEDWYSFTGPYDFNRSNETYTGTGDWIISSSDMAPKNVETGKIILKGTLQHIWKREGDKWFLFHELYHVCETFA